LLTSNLATDIITALAQPGVELPPAEEIAAQIKPTLSAHFKPALLARMTVVPYIPIRAEALRGIVEMKLGAVVARAHETHGVAVDVAPDVIAAIVDRCQEVESGARNVEHILRAVVMPALSRVILEDLAQRDEGALRVRLQVGGPQGIECVKVEG
jgi:type VI secretion system protein VasG